ncbi:MAG: protein kinase domain-containing protein, partial [Myxococcota bacterium]
MAAASDPDRWTGRSGRVYVLDPDAGARDGGMASIRRVLPKGAPNGVSTVPEGTVLALKIARTDDKLAEEALAREVETFVALSRAPGSPPCPRLYDLIGTPVAGLVMEWCPTDMERWWEATWTRPRAFVELCEALADVCRRVREYEAVAELELGKRVIHADIKPRNVLRAVDGRWLLTDFGASKSRSVEDTQWAATRMILGTENFIAPEALFNARKPHPAAMDTWSLGCTFFALLRMRVVLRGGGKMPSNGTHAHLFRTHRVALVGDLQQRKPALFVDKDLDPAQFVSPDKLPEKDRKAVAEALDGVFGRTSATLEGVLATECLNLLDRALRVDPARRFRDPLEMAGEFEALAQRYRELALRADGGFGSGRFGGTGEPAAPSGAEARAGRPGAPGA